MIGSAFKYLDELKSIVDNSASRVKIFQNIDFIYDLFYEADVAFCAGGNTLHELACIGTPTITVPTMPHEFKNGVKYEELGFGKCLDLTKRVRKEDVIKWFNRFLSLKGRLNNSRNGKRVTNGKGGIIVKDIIERML